MVSFVNSKDFTWGDQNIATANKTFDVDAIWVLDQDLNHVYTSVKDSNPHFKDIPIPPEIDSSLTKQWINHFYVFTNHELLEISTAPIQPSTDDFRETPPQGYFLSCRVWNKERLAKLTHLLNKDVEVLICEEPHDHLYSDDDHLEEIRDGKMVYPVELAGWSGSSASHMIFTDHTSLFHDYYRSLRLELYVFIGLITVILTLLYFTTIILIYVPLRKVINSLSTQNPTLVKSLQKQKHEFGILARLVVQSFQHRKELTNEITKQKVTEEALLESEKRYRTLVENSSDAIALMDGKRYLYVNPKFCQISGYTFQEITAPDFNWNIFFNDQTIFYAGDKIAVESLDHVIRKEFTIRILNRSGKQIDIELITVMVNSGSDSPVLIFGRDITERRQAEQTIVSSELKYRALFENSRDAIYIRTTEGKLIDFNQTMVDMFGYSREEMLSMDIYRLYEVAPDRRQLAEHKARFGSVVDFELKLRRADGKILDCLITSHELFDAKGARIGVQGLIRDITAKKQMEYELFQSQKMESVGKLAGGVAHDFNNMLQAVLGNLELAIGSVRPESDIFNNLIDAKQAAERSAELTRHLLAFARKQVISPKALDLNDVVGGTLKLLRRMLGENINLSWSPGARLWAIKFDPSQIDQILANLCVNARDAISEKGDVWVETRNVVLNEEFCAEHPGAFAGEYALLSVRDTGSGISDEIRKYIFEPFFTTKEVGKGTGLGLATVYGIVKQNNSFIDVLSEIGKGTTFSIYIPRFYTEIPLTTTEDSNLPHGSGETILLIDDEVEILSVGRNMLKHLGYNVLSAQKPSRLLELVESHPGEIYLLITDVVMPDLNGEKVAEAVRLRKPDIKVLFISGHTSEMIGKNDILAESTHFLQKPFNLRSLAEKVRAILEEKA